MDLKSAFDFHTTPFTRELPNDSHFSLLLYDQAREGILRAVEKRMSAALISPAGTGKTTVLRSVITCLPEARHRVHYVKCTNIGKRDMCREIARVCAVPPAGSFPALHQRLQERFEATLAEQGLRPVLILDEAHDLRPDVLSMLRILTNFNMDSRLRSHDRHPRSPRAEPGWRRTSRSRGRDRTTASDPPRNPCHRVCDETRRGPCDATSTISPKPLHVSSISRWRASCSRAELRL